jgi:phage terminase Nu1 subunit (DNA packaging protein)
MGLRKDVTCRPRPNSAAEIATLLGISSATVSKLASEGVLPRAGRGEYDAPGCVQAYVRHRLGTAAKEDPTVVRLMNERSRLTKAKADAAEREARVRGGELVEASEIEAAWVSVITTARNRLRLIPSKVALRVVGLKSPADAQELLRREIDDALDAIAHGPAI